MRFLIALGLCTILNIARPLTADDGPKKSDELQVLDRYIGSWETEVTVKGTGDTFKTKETRKWSKAGNFVISEDKNLTTQKEAHFLMTYDPSAKKYRACYIDEATAVILLGTWNEETQTMKWENAEGSPSKSNITDRFLDKDHREWSMAVTGPDGEVFVELSAKQARSKQ